MEAVVVLTVCRSLVTIIGTIIQSLGKVRNISASKIALKTTGQNKIVNGFNFCYNVGPKQAKNIRNPNGKPKVTDYLERVNCSSVFLIVVKQTGIADIAYQAQS